MSLFDIFCDTFNRLFLYYIVVRVSWVNLKPFWMATLASSVYQRRRGWTQRGLWAIQHRLFSGKQYFTHSFVSHFNVDVAKLLLTLFELKIFFVLWVGLIAKIYLICVLAASSAHTDLNFFAFLTIGSYVFFNVFVVAATSERSLFLSHIIRCLCHDLWAFSLSLNWLFTLLGQTFWNADLGGSCTIFQLWCALYWREVCLVSLRNQRFFSQSFT